MSVLAPLYLLGALAIGLPILFHLIRRRPTGAIEFSSLMFLEPTPPRLTRRSRLENWPLLLLRALALLLLAAAFARPFLRQSESVSSDTVGERVVLVVDTSASMQRPGLWEKIEADANAVIESLGPADQLAIISFANESQTLFSFEQSTDLSTEQRRIAALKIIRDTSPTWQATDLGRAVSYAADIATQYEADDVVTGDQDETTNVRGSARLVLLSDMQQGGQIESLQQYAWPKELRLEIRRVDVGQRTNASAQILQESQFAEDSDRIRVRVSNAADSETSRFTLRYVRDDAGVPNDDSDRADFPVQVPPGESRVVRMPLPDRSVTSILVSGDEQPFDNQRFMVSREPQALTLLFVGSSEDALQGDADGQTGEMARQSLLYYLQRVPLANARGTVSVTSVRPGQLTTIPPATTTPLIVVAQPLSSDTASQLQDYVKQGGRVLFVLARPESKELAATIAGVTNAAADALVISEAEVKDYAMLTDIQFQHPVFQPMADPKFNDFTKIRFWSHRTVQEVPDDWSILACFDDGQPALLEQSNGEGRVWVLATGWQPEASQLALSTKFLPLVYSFVGRLSGDVESYADVTVGDAPPFAPLPDAKIIDPSGVAFDFSPGNNSGLVNQPGIYTYQSSDQAGDQEDKTMQRFAVNLAASESNTTPLDNETFERFGIVLGKSVGSVQSEAAKRQLRDIELEKQQKIWQWLLAAALALLAIETLWGGLISRGGTPNRSVETTK